MKKILSFSALFLLLASYGFSQFEKSVEFGFQASPLVSFAQVVNDSSKQEIDGLTTKASMGFSFGLVTDFRIADPVALHTGLNIVAKGFSSEVDYSAIGLGTGVNKQRVTSLEIPLALKFRSPELGSSGMHVTGVFGGAAEINLQNSYTTDAIVVDTSGTVPTFSLVTQPAQKDNSRLNLFTFSFVPGAGVDWVQDWGTVTGGVSYHWGLMNIASKSFQEDQYTAQNPGQTIPAGQIIRTKLSYVALDLGYFF